jgi:elongator complex protein 6
MSSRIPPLLEPYLSLPSEASLILLTSVLGASSNWLVLRFLHSALLTSDVLPEDEPRVLLVSFMRDAAFWKENARRLVSVLLCTKFVVSEWVKYHESDGEKRC